MLKDAIPVLAGEVIDAAVMRAAALDAFLTEQIADAKAEGVLYSVHLKATMMKVSDPIIFGHAVRAFFPALFEQHGAALAAAGRQRQRRHRRAAGGARRDAGAQRAAIQASIDAPTRTARRSRWSTPTAGSPTCTSRAT